MASALIVCECCEREISKDQRISWREFRKQLRSLGWRRKALSNIWKCKRCQVAIQTVPPGATHTPPYRADVYIFNARLGRHVGI